MSDLYYAAATITALLGVVLVIAYVAKNFSEIAQTFGNFVEWTSENVVAIIAFFFLVSLAVTGLAALGTF